MMRGSAQILASVLSCLVVVVGACKSATPANNQSNADATAGADGSGTLGSGTNASGTAGSGTAGAGPEADATGPTTADANGTDTAVANAVGAAATAGGALPTLGTTSGANGSAVATSTTGVDQNGNVVTTTVTSGAPGETSTTATPVAVCNAPKRFYCLEFYSAQTTAQTLAQDQQSCASFNGQYQAGGSCPTTNAVGQCAIVNGGTGLATVYYSFNAAQMQAACTQAGGVWTP